MINQFVKEVESKQVLELNERDQLGGGQNGNVYLYKINNSTSVAIKCFKNKNAAMEEKKIYENIQKLAPNYPGIIGYYGMIQIQIKIKGTFDENYQGYAIFLQACERDFSKVIGQINLPIREIVNIWSQLILPLICLHRNGCFHGDIKPANILINSITNNQKKSYTYYLADFGEGKYTGIDISTNYETLTLRGTPYYFAPELYLIHSQRLAKGHYNPLKADIYSLGIIILQLLVGQDFIFRLNNERLNQQKYLIMINKIEQELKKYVELKNDPSLLKTLISMVNYEPRDRPSAIQICSQLILSKQFEIKNINESNLQVLVEWLILQLSQENNINSKTPESKNIEQQLKEQIVNQEKLLQETIENYEDIIKDFTKKIQEKDNIINFRILNAKEEYDKGMEFENNKMWKEALKCFTNCVQADNKHQSSWFNKGYCENELGNYQDAVESYHQALQIDPKDSIAWNNKGLALRNLGKYSEAIGCYDQTLQIDPKYSIAWNNKGLALNNLGKYSEALKCCNEALLINPKYDYALANKGEALNGLERYGEAVDCLNQAIAIQPTSGRYFNLGNSYSGLGKNKEALESYKQCEKMNSNYCNVKEKIKQLEKKWYQFF